MFFSCDQVTVSHFWSIMAIHVISNSFFYMHLYWQKNLTCKQYFTLVSFFTDARAWNDECAMCCSAVSTIHLLAHTGIRYTQFTVFKTSLSFETHGVVQIKALKNLKVYSKRAGAVSIEHHLPYLDSIHHYS